MYAKCFGMNRADSCCPAQLSAERGKKVANRVAIWAPAHSHCTVMITFIVPIDFQMAL